MFVLLEFCGKAMLNCKVNGTNVKILNATAVWTLPCIKLLGTIQEVWRQKKTKKT
jgi:hypothetical protein